MDIVNFKDIGAPNTPQEIKRLRRQASDYLRRQGEPVVHMHMFNPGDVKNGIAKKCPACFDSSYGQVRNLCPICFGIGFVSVENDPNRFIDENGRPTTSTTDTPAPLYGGFGQPIITWAVLPDVPEDIFKVNDAGVLIRTQEAEASAYWTPDMGDNDLLVQVTLASDQQTLTGIFDRFQLKQVNPQTIRGWGRRTTNEVHKVGQNFRVNLVPEDNILNNVPVGGVSYGAF